MINKLNLLFSNLLNLLQLFIFTIMQSQNWFKINLKFSTENRQIQIQVQSATSIAEIKTIIQAQTQAPSEKIKVVYKGKILNDNQTIQSLGITKTVTMVVVINKFQKKKQQEQPKQSIPTNFQTGLGSFNPVGFGNFGIMNHPQYMSSLANMNQQKMQQMLDDPYYQKMMEQLMNDPDTMIQMINQNPMTKQMMNSNPMMKMMLSNPEILKQVMNPDTIKMVKQMKKNGGLGNINNPTMFNQNQGGLGNLGALNTGMLPNIPNLNMNPQMNQLGYNSFMNPMSGLNANNFSSMYNNLGNIPNINANLMGFGNGLNVNENLQEKYKQQLLQMQGMGFTDKNKNIEALKICFGNVQAAIQRLFR